MKYFIISDVHSAPLTYQHFIDKGFDKHDNSHEIVFLGDLFDRGKHSLGVLQLVRELKRDIGDRLVLVVGNHDEMLRDFCSSMIEMSDTIYDEVDYDQGLYTHWMENGGKATARGLIGGLTKAAGYSNSKRRRAIDLIELVDGMVDYYETEEYIFTHAAINAKGEIDPWDRGFFYSDNPMGKDVFIGHTRHADIKAFPDDDIKEWVLECGGKALSYEKNNVYNIDDGTGLNIVVLEE